MPLELIINLWLSLFIPLLIGYAILLLIFGKISFNPFFSFAVSFGIGMGIIAQWMLLLSILGIDYRRGNVSLPLIILSLVGIFWATLKKCPGELSASETAILKKRNRTVCCPGFLNNSSLQIIAGIALMSFIAFQIYFIFWRALTVPICSWDPVYVIASKAKCFFYEGSIFSLKYYDLSSYPLQVPLSLTWVALNLGDWDEIAVKIIFPVIFLCYLIIQYVFIYCNTNKWWALLGVGLLVSANFPVYHTTIAYRDIFLMYYNMVAVFALFTGWKNNDGRYFFLAGLFAGFGVFTKLEGAGYLFIHSLACLFLLAKMKECCLRDKAVNFLKFIIPGIGIFLFYHLYKIFHHIVLYQDRFHFDFTWGGGLIRTGMILKQYVNHLFLTGDWNILWLLLMANLIVHKRKIMKDFRVQFFLLLLILYFSFYFAVALFTPNFISIAGVEAYTVLARIILHFFPLCPLLIVFLNYPIESKILMKKLDIF